MLEHLEMQRKLPKLLDFVLRLSHYRNSSLLSKHERMLRLRSSVRRRQGQSRSCMDRRGLSVDYPKDHLSAIKQPP